MLCLGQYFSAEILSVFIIAKQRKILRIQLDRFSELFYLLICYVFKVLHEWNSGKLRYYTHPPEDPSTQKPETAVSAEIVSQFSKEFDIDSLDEDLRQIVEGWFCVLLICKL